MSKQALFLFVIILAVAVFLRLYLLSDVPAGINRDESSIGFTAYSLLKTGADEYGGAFPISFQSFGDWKLPLYIYTVVPLVSMLGMTELAVRLPSAFFGILTVVLTFFLVLKMFRNTMLALLAMGLIAIAPWHLHLSRVESESNTAVFLVTLATLLFSHSFLPSPSSFPLKGEEHKKLPLSRGESPPAGGGVRVKTWLLIPSAIFFALSYYTYAGNHVFTTLLIFGLVFLYWKQIPKTKITGAAVVLFLLLSGLLFYHTLTEADKTKLSGIGIFGDPSIVHAKIELPRNEHQNPQSLLARLVHNKPVFALERIGQNYLNAYSPQFLFIKGGDNHAHNILHFGNMYLIEAPFLLLGFMYLLMVLKGKEKLLVLWWFLIAPVAASITKDAPHTNRMFAIFPILPLVVAFGLYWVWTILRKYKILGKLGVLGIVGLFILNFMIYMDRYYVHFPRDEVASWGNGFKQLSVVLTSADYRSKQVIMNKPEYSPYSFLLFYQRYDPSTYQKQAVRYPPTEDGFVHVKAFGRYEFRDIDWAQDVQIPNRLLIDQTNQVPEFIKNSYKTTAIVLPNGQPQFTIVETK